MDTLPSELITLIFSFLKLGEAITLQRVCKAVHNTLVEDTNPLLSNINLRACPTPSDWVVAKAPRLSSLTWSHKLPLADLHSVISSSSDRLKHLDVSYVDLELIHDLLPRLVQVQQLVLVGCNLTDEVLQGLSVLPQLTHLNISHNPRVTGNSLLDLRTELVSLAFEGCYLVEYQACQEIVDRSGSRLTELCIHGNSYSSEQVEALLRAAPNLTQFNIAHGETLACRALTALKAPQMQRLRILHAKLLLNTGLCEMLSRCSKHLAVLDLTNCQHLQDTALQLLAQNCPDLQELRLASCKGISDVGVLAVIQNCQLRVLSLVNTLITDAALPLDRPYPFYNTVKKIEVTKCLRISQVHVVRICSAYPHIQAVKMHHRGCMHLIPMHSWV